ncbi:RING finger protein 212B [Copidosoma floridanum]|uniref:RING finger protein 212B n=1 Tax=Copidosoma floridanum TaxID=29053 RepID=UPI000C6FA884|nr:RING finger protein 212B [Copidosoma floridanum]
MEWMRCNSCWLRIADKQTIFHLTQCGHIYCDKCITKAEERCCQCGSTGSISLPLKEPLSPQINHYFTPICDLLDKVVQAEQFQRAQVDLCLKRANENEHKYQTLKEAYWASAENLKKVYQKYVKLKAAYNTMHKERKLNTSLSFTQTGKSLYYTPPPQMKPNCQQSYSNGGRYIQQSQNNSNKGKDQIFRVPSMTRVPRSANSGYYTASPASSSSLNSRMNKSISNISKY